MASLRFPGKILFPIHGLPMVEHVRRRAKLSPDLQDVFVATCDKVISDEVQKNGGNVITTSKDHENGTSRVAEAVAKLNCTHVMLLQGDEPLLLPRHIQQMVERVKKEPNVEFWNATANLNSEVELSKHSFVKCAISQSGRIIHCFRKSPYFCSFDVQKVFVRKILGIMVFKREYLLQIAKIPSGSIENAESIEQMRSIENDVEIQSVNVSPALPSINERREVKYVLSTLDSDLEQKKLLKTIIEAKN